eukprot:TRINITY_DN4856_c0_g1_i1.p1 TRINITY_DN4856_c0_g1~~TRINITY_DN4856_c0_g1_i1.p1  ORF type:complete len:330 (+),score=124.62 TRINITY_DN4856_c0_g1_i1:25-1014(+)
MDLEDLDDISGELEPLDPNINDLLNNKTLKWIFVGGKGGVGKTTTSSSIAIQLSKVRENVLIISTDPAHNLSDAFNQKFSKTPTPVEGYKNLFAMEIDPTQQQDEETNVLEETKKEKKLLMELAYAFPGIDEAMSFAEVMKLVQSMQFSVIVFDTAPTGHTLRFLSFPSILENGLGKLFGMKSKMGPLLQQFGNLMGSGFNEEQIMGKMEQTKTIIDEVNKQFKNPEMTTFVCVCIPEFLSLYETERLVQELGKFKIDVQHVVINQVLHPSDNCSHCQSRKKMQEKYINQIKSLFEDFHIIQLPALDHEIRGIKDLNDFSQYLTKDEQK